ncbi:adenosine deaminase [Corynebacterium sp.]|uniref:adenosine deaminase n=1 Tax=Corynebacterium sp. TaxID=1720 RepID=UPI0026DB6F17|nr:adenosine deaminase [Corynebacterium sp.]MDO5077158.1 adenosine deaminase [Corynebacterium sp.]
MQPDHASPVLSESEIHSLPKVLLHDHLDGGLRPATIIELAQECGYTELPTTDPEELESWFYTAASSGSLPKYLETFKHTCAVMQTALALRRVAREAVIDLSRDNIVYAELRFAPEQHLEDGLSLQDVVDAVTDGLREGMELVDNEWGIEARLILCGMRHSNRTAEIAQLTVDNYHQDSLVVGFDIAGAEDGFPPSQHAEAFQLLRENFVPFTIHAGEAAGVESLESAVRQGTLRIGHGVRMFEDFHAVINGLATGPMSSYVRDRRIALEMCPTSNLQTGIVDDYADYPLPMLREMGFCCTVNTDNRLVSGTTLTREMMILVDYFGFEEAELFDLTKNAIENAFAPWFLRRIILEKIILPAYQARQFAQMEEFSRDALGMVGDDEDYNVDDLNFDLSMLEDLGINLSDLGIGADDGPVELPPSEDQEDGDNKK